MKKDEFAAIREELGLTQQELSHLLVVSIRSIQSYEQGWRKIAPAVERNLLLLLMYHRQGQEAQKNLYCWQVLGCPEEKRETCWGYRLFPHNLCWYITGTTCPTMKNLSWNQKIAHCRQCKVFLDLFKKRR